MNKRQSLIKELEKLRDSFATITKMWYEETELCDEVLQPDYPFEKSFDDQSSEVHNWVEGAIAELEYKFEVNEKVHFFRQPMQYVDGKPVEYYFKERVKDQILISLEKEVQEDGYDDWWVDAKYVVPAKGWPNEV